MGFNLPATLIENLKAGLCVPWCGAGTSVTAGLPTWRQLGSEFVETCVTNGVAAAEATELHDLASRGNFDDVIEFSRGFLGEGEYRQLLTRLFGGPPKPTDLHRLVVGLPAPAIFTTNYDRLFEQALVENRGTMPTVYTSYDATTLWLQFATKQHFLLKLHGDITRPDTVVLTSRDYAQHIFGNVSFMSFLQRIFVSTSILFIGTSLSDGYLRRLLEETAFMTQGVAMPHFAILFRAGAIETRALRDRFNIRVIDLRNWSDLPLLLQALLDAVGT